MKVLIYLTFVTRGDDEHMKRICYVKKKWITVTTYEIILNEDNLSSLGGIQMLWFRK